MQKFKPITRQELLQRIIRAIPEINPDYVTKTLRDAKLSIYDVSMVHEWICYFENELYGKGGGADGKTA